MFTSKSVIAGLVVVAVVTIGLTGCASTTQRVGVRHIVYPVSSCPASTSVPETTTDPGSSASLVPFVPRGAVLCNYGWHLGTPSHGRFLVHSATLPASAAAAFATRLNHDVSSAPQGASGCPVDTGGVLDAFFWAYHVHIEVAVTTSGCKYADNGTQSAAWVGDSDLSSQLTALLGKVS